MGGTNSSSPVGGLYVLSVVPTTIQLSYNSSYPINKSKTVLIKT